ncbi:CRIS2 protein, partial [Thinocorus orbignyianus]|nr:CRIS2 protein [Thinocorus orbignyianus]
SLDALSTTKADQQNVIVDKHNSLRRGVTPTASNMMKMVWSPSAAKNAQNWANQCSLSHSPVSMRTTTVPCGENLFMSTAPFTWSDAIQSWYDEQKDFKYGTGAKTEGAVVGHYTQVVWYNSDQIGCGMAYCPKNTYKYFYVCQYCPAGNNAVQIATPYRSGPKCADCPGYCDRGLCTNPCKHQDFFGNCRNLKILFGCNHSLVKEKCSATCRCTTQII